MDKNRGDGGIVTILCQVFFHSGTKNCSKKVSFYVEIIHLRCFNLRLMVILVT